jgi:hypothetical protein
LENIKEVILYFPTKFFPKKASLMKSSTSTTELHIIQWNSQKTFYFPILFNKQKYFKMLCFWQFYSAHNKSIFIYRCYTIEMLFCMWPLVYINLCFFYIFCFSRSKHYFRKIFTVFERYVNWFCNKNFFYMILIVL